MKRFLSLAFLVCFFAAVCANEPRHPSVTAAFAVG
jgi:hypothetical protein